MNQSIENGLTVLEFSRRNLLGLAEDIPTEKLCHQPAPNTNHALWVLGHLAWTDDFFLADLAKQPSRLGERWTKLFGAGSTPSPDPSAYPPISEIRDALGSARERLCAWFKDMDEKQLRSPLPDDYKVFAPNYAALMNSIAWHEGLHTGQLATCRRSLGLKPKFM